MKRTRLNERQIRLLKCFKRGLNNGHNRSPHNIKQMTKIDKLFLDLSSFFENSFYETDFHQSFFTNSHYGFFT